MTERPNADYVAADENVHTPTRGEDDSTQYAEFVRHVMVKTPNWDTKIRCSCGGEFGSRCEFFKHGYEAMLDSWDGVVMRLKDGA